MYCMRIDSCRKCGTDLKVDQSCSVCNEPTTFKCENCNIETDMQYHIQCMLVDFDYKLLQASVA